MATPYPGEKYSEFTLEMLRTLPRLMAMQEPPQPPTPYSERGLENPPGWEALCRRMFHELDLLNRPFENTDQSLQFAQVKTKYAQLRVYIERCPKEIAQAVRDVIKKYEEEADRTCERSGRPGQLYQQNHWLFVAAPDIAEKLDGVVLRSEPAPKPVSLGEAITAPVADVRMEPGQ